MNLATTSKLILALSLGSALALPAGASFTSSASSAGSASSRASSDSISSSSSSDEKGKDKTALVQNGQYRVAAVQALDGPSNTLRINLEPEAAVHQKAFRLDVPVKALNGKYPEIGDIIRAERLDYGVKFARATDKEPFLLVLADAWNAQIESRPL
ncbi:MAG: hypothetical protein RSD57_03160 [Comamonas sp.]